MPIAAFCTDIHEFQAGRVLDAAFAARFPGAAVIPAFAQQMTEMGWEVVTGDQALEQIRCGEMVATEVYVVQEENSAVGLALLEQGAHPVLILSGESPLYAPNFYRDISLISRPFPHRVLFTGAHSEVGDGGTNHPLLFPAFHQGEALALRPWSDRRYLALLAGNKYWRHAAVPWPDRLKRAWQELRTRDGKRWLKRHQLHDARLHLVAHFSSTGMIDVFGTGWNRLDHLPRTWRERLADLQPAGDSVPYEDKHTLLSAYKFTLAIENCEFPGYVTEKIFDALAAGSIALYRGAPDIEDFVPASAFIDLRNFDDPSALHNYLDSIHEAQATEMLAEGREFLMSRHGQQHTFEDRGEFLANLVVKSATG